MCDTCLQEPCTTQCPNAEEPTAILFCDRCNEPVFLGYNYYVEPIGRTLCEECIENMTTKDILDHFDCQLCVAEESE